SLQLIRTNSCSPVSGPLWPRLGVEWKPAAATFQASCCASVSASNRRACCTSRSRTSSCRSVRGFLGVTRMRRIRPLRPGHVTVRPSFPVCGMSCIFIYYLPFCCCCLCCEPRAWPVVGRQLHAPNTCHPYGGKKNLPDSGGFGFQRLVDEP